MDQPIDSKNITTSYKKNGTFDKQRKRLLDNFKQSETHSNLLIKLKVLVESKIKQDPQILLKNKGKVSALIQGEIINSKSSGLDILNVMDKDIRDKIVNSEEFQKELKTELKDIMRKMMGVSDEAYAVQLEKESAEEAEEKRKKEEAERALREEEELRQEERRLEERPLEERRLEERRKQDYKFTTNPKVVKPPIRFNLKKQLEQDSDSTGSKVNFLKY